MEDSAFFVLRVVVGLLFAGHGAQKLFGWFGGDGIFGTADLLRSLGLRPALLWAAAVGLAELSGGLATALGLLGPLGPLAILAPMVVAIVVVHRANGLWAEQGGIELPLINAAIALALALGGPGAYALDAAIGLALPMPETLFGGAALIGLGVALALASRVSPAPTAASGEQRSIS